MGRGASSATATAGVPAGAETAPRVPPPPPPTPPPCALLRLLPGPTPTPTDATDDAVKADTPESTDSAATAAAVAGPRGAAGADDTAAAAAAAAAASAGVGAGPRVGDECTLRATPEDVVRGRAPPDAAARPDTTLEYAAGAPEDGMAAGGSVDDTARDSDDASAGTELASRTGDRDADRVPPPTAPPPLPPPPLLLSATASMSSKLEYERGFPPGPDASNERG